MIEIFTSKREVQCWWGSMQIRDGMIHPLFVGGNTLHITKIGLSVELIINVTITLQYKYIKYL